MVEYCCQGQGLEYGYKKAAYYDGFLLGHFIYNPFVFLLNAH